MTETPEQKREAAKLEEILKLMRTAKGHAFEVFQRQGNKLLRKLGWM